MRQLILRAMFASNDGSEGPTYVRHASEGGNVKNRDSRHATGCPKCRRRVLACVAVILADEAFQGGARGALDRLASVLADLHHKAAVEILRRMEDDR